jgi:Subtilase family
MIKILKSIFPCIALIASTINFAHAMESSGNNVEDFLQTGGSHGRGAGIKIAVLEFGAAIPKVCSSNTTIKSSYLDDTPRSKSHGEAVSACVASIAPDAKIEIYTPFDMERVAHDPSIQIVSCSAYISFGISEVAKILFEEFLKCFVNTGKLVCLSMTNEHLPIHWINEAEVALNYAEGKGFSLILCSTCSARDEKNMGVGPYIDPLNPATTPYMPFFVQAPGHKLKLPGYSDPTSGTSFSTPFVAGSAAILWGDRRDLNHKIVRRCLVESSRKVTFEILNPIEFRQKVLLIKRVMRFLSSRTSSIDTGGLYKGMDPLIISNIYLWDALPTLESKDSDQTLFAKEFNRVYREEIISKRFFIDLRDDLSFQKKREAYENLISSLFNLTYAFIHTHAKDLSHHFSEPELFEIVNTRNLQLYRAYVSVKEAVEYAKRFELL